MSKLRNYFGLALFMGCICLMLLAAPTAWAESPTGQINVVKLWQEDNADAHPNSITVELFADGTLVDALTLQGDTSSSSWMGSFSPLPVYDGERTINYTVREQNRQEYKSVVVQQPKLPALTISSWGEKVTPASESTYPIGSNNILVAKKGGSYFVWTRSALDLSQQEQLIYLVNEAKLQGLGKELSFSNTLFRNGLPAFFEDNGVSINGSAGNLSVEFSKSSDWSLFYTGLLGIREAKEAIIENRLAPVPSPSPQPTAQPSPEPSPSPVPTLTYSVEKVWIDRDESLRSENAYIEVYKNGQLWQTLILNEENGWTESWQVPDDGASWAVKEIRIPEAYNCSVTGDGNRFTVTNTSKDIPATGDVSDIEFYAVSAALCLMVLTVIIALPLLIVKGKKE